MRPVSVRRMIQGTIMMFLTAAFSRSTSWNFRASVVASHDLGTGNVSGELAAYFQFLLTILQKLDISLSYQSVGRSGGTLDL